MLRHARTSQPTALQRAIFLPGPYSFHPADSSMGGPAPLPIKKRVRAAAACASCRWKIIRCDEQRPSCGTCMPEEQPCSYLKTRALKALQRQETFVSHQQEDMRKLKEKILCMQSNEVQKEKLQESMENLEQQVRAFMQKMAQRIQSLEDELQEIATLQRNPDSSAGHLFGRISSSLPAHGVTGSVYHGKPYEHR